VLEIDKSTWTGVGQPALRAAGNREASPATLTLCMHAMQQLKFRKTIFSLEKQFEIQNKKKQLFTSIARKIRHRMPE
jgi:hypothetical protein